MQSEFLGTFAGNQVFLPGINGENTYGRKSDFISDFRKKLTNDAFFGDDFIKIGNKYYTGGYFKIIKTYDSVIATNTNCFQHAIGSFPKLATKEMHDAVADRIDLVVNEYFANVTEAKEGDLAVYYNLSGPTHAGIYRKSNPIGSSAHGGTIESKWGWLKNPYVFQHDVFCVPASYGDQVKFFRLKSNN